MGSQLVCSCHTLLFYIFYYIFPESHSISTNLLTWRSCGTFLQYCVALFSLSAPPFPFFWPSVISHSLHVNTWLQSQKVWLCLLPHKWIWLAGFPPVKLDCSRLEWLAGNGLLLQSAMLGTDLLTSDQWTLHKTDTFIWFILTIFTGGRHILVTFSVKKLKGD